MASRISFVHVGEKKHSVHGAGEHWNEKDGCVRGSEELTPENKIKLIRKGCVRYCMGT